MLDPGLTVALLALALAVAPDAESIPVTPAYSATLAYCTSAVALRDTVILVPAPAAVVPRPYQTSASPLAEHPVAVALTQVSESPVTPVTWESTAVAGVDEVRVQAWDTDSTRACPAPTPLLKVTWNDEALPAGLVVDWRTNGLVTVMVSSLVSDRPLASKTMTVKVDVASEEPRVPEMTPVALSSASPLGSTPVSTDHDRSGVPPVAARVWE